MVPFDRFCCIRLHKVKTFASIEKVKITMCQHQQQKIKAHTFAATNPRLVNVNTEDSKTSFVSCGIDRSCPTSVTANQGQGVRLDQYQSSIRQKVDKRRRRKNIEDRELGTTYTSFTTYEPSTDFHGKIAMDHEFEWYDLDAIRELEGGNSYEDYAITVGHDFHAGLIFTTERQILSKEVEMNIINHCTDQSKNGQEFDLFFWVNGDHGETQDERDFRERMEELEAEIKCDSPLSPPPQLQLSSSFSSSSTSLSDEIEEKSGGDIGSFLTSWL